MGELLEKGLSQCLAVVLYVVPHSFPSRFLFLAMETPSRQYLALLEPFVLDLLFLFSPARHAYP